MKALSSRDWFGKGSAGLALGFVLALEAAGLFLRLTPQGGGAKLQLAMWLMAPVWALIFSFVFLFRSSARAWAVLGLAALLLALLLGLLSP